jgi:PiT family inorganic phosphate transporter
MTLLIIVIILAIVFDYINGFHDAANSIATIVSTKVLTPVQAVFWAAAFNFVAFFLFKDHAVANTIGKSVHKEYITLTVILSGLIAAIIWNLLTWWYGIPSSSSHTLIGGFAGAALAHAYFRMNGGTLGSIIEIDKITKTILFIFLAPLIGMIVSIFITLFTIMRNTWIRSAIFAGLAIITFFLFNYFQDQKLNDNLAKFYKVENLQKEAQKDPAKQAKLDSVQSLLDAAKPVLAKYNRYGAEKTADEVKATVDPGIDAAKLAKEFKKADNRIITYSMMGALAIFILVFIYSEKIKTPTASSIANMFKRLQLLSSAAFSIGHGGNDAQKVMGIIAAAFVAYDGSKYSDVGAALKDLSWVPLVCYTAIGLGTMSGGWKIVKTMGTRITKVTPLEGVCAETSGAFTLFLTEQMGIPVSTTHTITGSIIGTGVTKRLSAVRWGLSVNLLWAWILTIPVSALLAGIIYMIVSYFIKG